LKELHRIVNEAIRTEGEGTDQTEGIRVDLSRLDFDKLRQEFAKKVKRKHAALQDIRTVVETKLAAMLANNAQRMDYYRRYQEIVANYNREKDRATVEATFAAMAQLAQSLDEEAQRHIREGLSEQELAFFDLLLKNDISKADRERLKQASRELLVALRERLASMPNWTKNTTTQADVKILVLDTLYQSLPRPPFTDEETEALADRLYGFIWQRSESGALFTEAA
jgi:type I restriction enzyme R subunit